MGSLLYMFQKGQVYKAKVEVSEDLVGFGRATVVAVDARGISLQIKSSKGEQLKIQAGAKIWLVASTLNTKFSGLWYTEVRGLKLDKGVPTMECRLPRFEQSSQKRHQSRTQVNAALEIEGDEWKDLAGKLVTRNISRLGLGFSVPASDLRERFKADDVITLSFKVGDIVVKNKHRIVNTRFNWLLNRTDVGAEIIDMDAETLENLERVLLLLSTKSKENMKAALSESGSLARWVKASKDKLDLVKTGEIERPGDQSKLRDLAAQGDAELGEFDDVEEDFGME